MSYSLGYYSSDTTKDGKYRKIRVEIKGLPQELSLGLVTDILPRKDSLPDKKAARNRL